jgi:protein TonB
MQVKKNPKFDLNLNSGLYFVIGLTLVLFLTWRALEYKTYDKEDLLVESMNVVDEIKEDVPMTEQVKTLPPPPPPAAPEIIQIVEDNDDIEETIIESTETDQESVIEAPVEVDDIIVDELEEEISVPFAIIEDIPIFPGCEDIKIKEEQRACFQKKIQEHVAKEFKYPEVAIEMNIQGKVYVQFAINTKGYISDIRVRGPDKNLENEAVRIVAAIPKMTPGMQRGRAVRVPYSIPINFKLE